MQVSVETTAGLERKLTLQIPADEVDGEVDKRVADTAKKARLPGFRPGKVPRKVVMQRYGDSLRAEVLQEVADRCYQQAIAQESLKPVGAPNIDITKNARGENVELVATFEVYPEVQIGDLSELKLEKYIAEVRDEDIDNMLEKLRQQRAEYIEVDRAAKDTDQLNIDYVGKRDGEPFEGGTAEGQELVLGSGQLIDGFESGLVGSKAGETRELELTFPEDYHASELAGQPVTFEVTVNNVKEAKLPELDDDFIKAFEVDGSIDDFKASVRENMETQLKDAIEANLKAQVMDGLVEANQVDLPEALVRQEIGSLRANAIQRFGGKAQDFDESLLPDEMFREQAEKRTALGVILNRVVEDQEIKPTREQLIEFIDGIAESYENPDEVRNMYMSNEQMLQQVNLLVVERLVVEKIVELAGATDKQATYDEVLKAQPVTGLNVG